MTNAARVMDQTADALEAQAQVLLTQAGYLRAEAHREASARQSGTIVEEAQAVTIQRACEIAAVSEWIIREAIKDGKLPTVKLGRSAVRIRVSAIRDWMRSGEKRIR